MASVLRSRSRLGRTLVMGAIGLLASPLLVRPAAAGSTVQVVASGLNFPTNLAFAPDGRIFFNEKETGHIRIIERGRLLPRPFATLPAWGGAERGVLGLALDPNFATNPWVYVYYSDRSSGHNELVRIRAHGNHGGRIQHLFTFLPASAGYHNGGDIAFGPDGRLYAVTGEIHDAARAQDVHDVGGKVLRFNPNGTVPPGNPFGAGNPVWSYGHRNSFGLCFDHANGELWETENGPSSDDEVNHIVRGGNYGWPLHLGAGGAPRYRPPALVFPHVIVPTGCAFWSRDASGRPTLWFGDFGGTLHRTTALPGGRLADHRIVSGLQGITDLEAGPDGNLYYSTANSIGRIRQAVSASPSPAVTTSSGSPSAAGSPPLVIATVPASGGGSGAVATWAVVALAALGVSAVSVVSVVVHRRRRGWHPPRTAGRP